MNAESESERISNKCKPSPLLDCKVEVNKIIYIYVIIIFII